MAQIHSANTCHNFLRVSRVFEIDSEIVEQSALVTAEVEMIVLSPFALCSPIASSCTGMYWDMKQGEAKPSWITREGFSVARKLRIEKAFAFQKTDSGWRSNTPALQPVDFSVAVSGHNYVNDDQFILTMLQCIWNARPFACRNDDTKFLFSVRVVL